jgi:hypothetical protein
MACLELSMRTVVQTTCSNKKRTSVGCPDQGINKLQHIVFRPAMAKRKRERSPTRYVELSEEEYEADADQSEYQDSAPPRHTEVYRNRH